MILAPAKDLKPARKWPEVTHVNGPVVYVLLCDGGLLYVGSTANLDRRLREHFEQEGKGAIFTRLRRPIRLLHTAPGNSTDEYHLAKDLRRLYPKRVVGGEATKLEYKKNLITAVKQPAKDIVFEIPF